MSQGQGCYFEHRAVYRYPTTAPFHPSTAYPEFRWHEVTAREENQVYDMVRQCFLNLGLDAAHQGTIKWNPLAGVIKEGDTVLVKPNMVLHQNGIAQNGTDCLITHPSVVRAVVDYVVLALNGTGRIIIGDAPIQTCDFDKLVHEQGYRELIAFYQGKGVPVSLHDFRLFKSVVRAGIAMSLPGESEDMFNYSVVDLGEGSEFHGIEEERYRKLRVTNYDPDKMLEHHNPRRNEYLVPNIVLSADVVINMPKPKTHKKAGVTIGLKNLVGITGHKDWLPHHSQGSPCQKGDEYRHPSRLRHAKVLAQEQIDKAGHSGNFARALLLKGGQLGLRLLDRLFAKDSINDGNWYGNDTIWRTIIDLNKVLAYSDKNGTLRDKPQRTLLVVSDMIISGEKEGPLLPSPKEVGVIGVGFDFVAFDLACATLMGFDVEKIPTLRQAGRVTRYPLTAPGAADRPIRSNNPFWNGKTRAQIHKDCTLNYTASKGWQGHIELGDSAQLPDHVRPRPEVAAPCERTNF